MLSTSSGNLVVFNLPQNLYKVATIHLQTQGAEYSLNNTSEGGEQTVKTINPSVEVERVERHNLLNILSNPLTKPTIKRPIYVHRTDSLIEIHPFSTYVGPNEVTDENGETVSIYEQNPQDWTDVYHLDGIGGSHNAGLLVTISSINNSLSVDGAKVLVDYWKIPSSPNWGYVVVGGKALYNSSTTIDFSLHPMEEEPLVTKILSLAGVTIEKQDLIRVGMGREQQTKQEQNT